MNLPLISRNSTSPSAGECKARTDLNNIPTARAEEISQRSLLLASQWRMAPLPFIYDVCFNYIAEADPRLKQKLDGLLERKPQPDQFELQSMYAELLERRTAYLKDLGKAGSHLTKQTKTIRSQIDQHIAACDSYSSDLENTASRIPEAMSSPDRLKRLVDELATRSQQMSESTRDLRTRMAEAVREIRQLGEELEKARKRELLDPLTGVFNRRGFDKQLVKVIEKARATKTGVTLILSDIDHFKDINDTYGHQIGDEVIKFVAFLMKHHTVESEIVARIGGEEFAIIIPDREVGDVLSIAEKTRSELEAKKLKITMTGQIIKKVTISSGVAVLKPEDDDYSLFRRADQALYRAKQDGRNQTCFLKD